MAIMKPLPQPYRTVPCYNATVFTSDLAIADRPRSLLLAYVTASNVEFDYDSSNDITHL